jgi:hypothetical protein
MPFPADLINFLTAVVPAGGVQNKDVFENVWKVVTECGEEERHFNQLQSVYRGIASTWLLATFGAVGYLLYDKEGKLAHPGIAGGVCLLGACGIVLLWLLDLKVYYALLEAAFWEGQALEQYCPWLPRIRERMTLHAGRVRLKLAGYYFLTAIVPLCVGVGLFYYYGFRSAAFLSATVGGLIGVALLLWTGIGEH